jgi:hypothetical protein
MTISELKRTVNFVKQTVIEPGVPAHFQRLIQVLQQNAQQNGQQQQPITTQKASLIAAIKAIRIQTLTLNERRLLKTFIEPDLMGDTGVEKINQIFIDHNLDPMGAVNAFSKIKTQYDQLIAAANDTIKVLAPIDLPAVEMNIAEGFAVLQVTFKEKASIANVSEWHHSSDDWWHIVRSFGLLTDTTTDDAKVLSFQQGSVVVEISAVYLLVKALGIAADKSLNVIERLLELRKKIAEFKQLDLSNKKIERELEKESATFIESQSKLIGEQVIAEINKDKLENGEVVNAINMAVDKLFKFLDNGGTVDCRLKQIDKQPPEAEQLRDNFSKIRTLETRIRELKLISDGSDKSS